MKFLQVFFIAITCILVASCASEEKYSDALNTWLGATEGQLLSVFGTPNSVYQSNGLTYLSYQRSSMGYIGGTGGVAQTTVVGNTAYTAQYGGRPGFATNYWCETTFVLKNGTIVDWNWRGNACRSN